MADLESALISEIAANNTAPSPDGLPPNSSPNIVYTEGREVLGSIKRDWNRRNATVTAGGTANALTLSYTVNPTALVRGQRYAFVANTANTGPTTLAIGGLAATAVLANGTSLIGGELQPTLITEVIYDGVNFQIIGGSGVGAGAGTRGTTTNDNAAAGYVGEVMGSNVTAAVTLTTATTANIGSITLTPGDWNVQGEVWFSIGTGGATGLHAGITAASATLPATTAFNTSRATVNAAFQASVSDVLSLRPAWLSLAVSTPIYLVALAAFPSGTITATGNIWARRAR